MKMNADIDISGKDVCVQISQLKKRWVDNGKCMTDSPNDSFLKFTGIAEILSDNASTCYITICSVLFTSLIPDLQKR